MIFSDAVALTKSDTVEHNVAGLWVGGAGTVTVDTEDGTRVAFGAVPAGTFLPIRVLRLRSTGTSATNVVGYRGRIRPR